MTMQPPMPKNITIFCVSAKILMPNTTNRKPITLKSVTSSSVTAVELVTHLAAPLSPM